MDWQVSLWLYNVVIYIDSNGWYISSLGMKFIMVIIYINNNKQTYNIYICLEIHIHLLDNICNVYLYHGCEENQWSIWTGLKNESMPMFYLSVLTLCRHIAWLTNCGLISNILHVECSYLSMPYRCQGPRLNIKTVLSTYGDFHVKDKTAVRTSYL